MNFVSNKIELIKVISKFILDKFCSNSENFNSILSDCYFNTFFQLKVENDNLNCQLNSAVFKFEDVTCKVHSIYYNYNNSRKLALIIDSSSYYCFDFNISENDINCYFSNNYNQLVLINLESIHRLGIFLEKINEVPIAWVKNKEIDLDKIKSILKLVLFN